MNSLILIVLSLIILCPYLLYQNRGHLEKKKRKQSHIVPLRRAEAGPTKRNILLYKLFRRQTNLMALKKVDMANIQRDPDLQYFLVINDCMVPHKIYDGDIIGVRMFENIADIRNNDNTGRLLIIFLDNPNFIGYKIREQGNFIESENSYETFYYINNKKIKSSKNHSISSIKGVVVEVHQRALIANRRVD